VPRSEYKETSALRETGAMTTEWIAIQTRYPTCSTQHHLRTIRPRPG